MACHSVKGPGIKDRVFVSNVSAGRDRACFAKRVGRCAILPENKRRRVGDIDLAVSEADYVAASEIARSEEAIQLNIDLHCELRDRDTLPWELIVAKSELVEIDNEKIRVLGEEDHLRVLAFHWLVDGGRYKDKLWDLYYAVENR